MPASTRVSSSWSRSSRLSEVASLLVPNTARPQFCESSHRQCRTSRSASTDRSALNGVTTGERTPVIRGAARPRELSRTDVVAVSAMSSSIRYRASRASRPIHSTQHGDDKRCRTAHSRARPLHAGTATTEPSMIPAKQDLSLCFAHVAYQFQALFERRRTGIASFQAWSRAELDERIGEADVLVISGLWRNDLIDRAKRL